MNHSSISLNFRHVAWCIALLIVLLVAAHFAIAHRDIPGVRLFHLGSEGGFGTAFAAGMGFLAGLVALGLARLNRDQFVTSVWWLFLSLGMVAYAVDEVAQVHEGLWKVFDPVLRGADNSMAGTAMLGYLALPFFALAVWGMLRSAEKAASALIGGGLVLFWLGAFGVEELEYLNSIGALFLTQNLPMMTADFILVGIQEALELTGIAAILLGVLVQLSLKHPAFSLMVTGSATRDNG